MADETNILEQAATATQGMIPGQGRQQNMTAFGPTPLVQPPPIPRFQPPPDQSNRPTSFTSVGSRKRADKQALFHGIAGFVKSGSDLLAAKKERALSMDITRLMEATQGRTEAQQALQQDPNNKEAKTALEKNTAIINDITSDPKKSKQLQKALNIDLFGGGKNKEENQALIKAWGDFQKKQQEGDKTALNPAAQRLEASQPQRLGLDPEAQAQAQAIKQGLLPKAGELLKVYQENFKTLQTAKSSEDRTAAMKEHDKILGENAKLIASTKDKQTEAYLERTISQRMTADDRNKIQLKIAEIKSADNEKHLNLIRDISTTKGLNERDKTILGSLVKEGDTYSKQIKFYQDDNAKIQIELDKKATSLGPFVIHAANDTDAKLMRQKQGMNNMAIKIMQNNFDETMKKLQMLQQIGIITLSGTGEVSGDSGSSNNESSDINVNDNEVPE